jgi:uncharacterized protein YegJ (DUF2314 family)
MSKKQPKKATAKELWAMQRRALEALRMKSLPGLQKWVGRGVKKGYPADPGEYSKSEHMWLTVLSVEGTRLRCELASTPFYLTYMQRGDIVEIEESEIEEVWIVET